MWLRHDQGCDSKEVIVATSQRIVNSYSPGRNRVGNLVLLSDTRCLHYGLLGPVEIPWVSCGKTKLLAAFYVGISRDDCAHAGALLPPALAFIRVLGSRHLT